MPDDEEDINVNTEKTVNSTNVNNDSAAVENINTNKEENIVANSTEKEELYAVQYLIDNCKALGYKREVVTGALLNCEKTEMTKTEFEETIKNFLGKKVS